MKNILSNQLNLHYYCDHHRHLVCIPYSIKNLHEMAIDLNIDRCWFHKDHYDIPKRRIREISEKCIITSSRSILEIIQTGDLNVMSKQIAEKLLSINAVKLSPKKFFTWSSGIKSPIYCDNRVIFSNVDVRREILSHLVSVIHSKFKRPDLICGVATGGISPGVLAAHEMYLPFIYARPEAKSHGLKNTIEGEFKKGQTVIVVEDLISTGGSSIKVVEALKKAGLKVNGVVSIFNYGLKSSNELFEKAKCKVVSLCDYDSLLEQAISTGHIQSEDLKILQEWKDELMSTKKTRSK